MPEIKLFVSLIVFSGGFFFSEMKMPFLRDVDNVIIQLILFNV